MTRDQIIAALPALSRADLRAVANAAHLLSGTSAAEEADWLLPAIRAYLIKRGTITPTNSLRFGAPYRVYADKLPPVLTWLETLLTNPRAQTQLAMLATRALGALLERRGIFCRETMLAQIDQIPQAVDAQFPGYYEAGMFSWLLQGKDADNAINAFT